MRKLRERVTGMLPSGQHVVEKYVLRGDPTEHDLTIARADAVARLRGRGAVAAVIAAHDGMRLNLLPEQMAQVIAK